MTSESAFNAESTTEDVLRGIDLRGKTAVITGASGGLGAETARALAKHGATVVLVSRDLEKTQAKADEIRQLTDNLNVSAVQCDLADQENIKDAAKSILNQHPQIQLLINNAGIMACDFSTTVQGLETQFGVNHIGHFLLTNLLAPALLAGAPSRVVALSSAGHKYGSVDTSDPNWEKTDYDKWRAYGAAKTANALFAVALNERLNAKGVTANAVHPGVIFTDLARHLTEEDIKMLSGGLPKAEEKNPQAGEEVQGKRGKMILKSVESGAATSVWAATHPSLEGRGGLYLEDCSVGVRVNPPEQKHGYFEYALDKNLANELWTASEKIVGLTFDV